MEEFFDDINENSNSNIKKIIKEVGEALEENSKFKSNLKNSEPFAWMYGNKTGFRTVYYADWIDKDPISKKMLEADMHTAKQYPNAHWVIPLYTH